MLIAQFFKIDSKAVHRKMLKYIDRRIGFSAVLPLQLIRISGKKRFFSSFAVPHQPKRTTECFLQGSGMGSEPLLRFFKKAAELFTAIFE